MFDQPGSVDYDSSLILHSILNVSLLHSPICYESLTIFNKLSLKLCHYLLYPVSDWEKMFLFTRRICSQDKHTDIFLPPSLVLPTVTTT